MNDSVFQTWTLKKKRKKKKVTSCQDWNILLWTVKVKRIGNQYRLMNKEENLGINYRKLIWVIFLFFKEDFIKKKERDIQSIGRQKRLHQREEDGYLPLQMRKERDERNRWECKQSELYSQLNKSHGGRKSLHFCKL